MKTTRYFEEQILRKRPYLRRVRYWIFIEELGKYLRVVTPADGETAHNAFLDRDFQEVT